MDALFSVLFSILSFICTIAFFIFVIVKIFEENGPIDKWRKERKREEHRRQVAELDARRRAEGRDHTYQDGMKSWATDEDGNSIAPSSEVRGL